MRFKKSFAICFLAFVLAISFCGCSEFNQYTEKENTETLEQEIAEEPDPAGFLNEGVSDEEIKEKIFSVFTEINVNPKFFKEIEKTEDETGTEKYSFLYRNNTFTVTLDENSDVHSVKVGEDGVDVYLKGQKSDNIDHYVASDEMMRTVDWYIYSGVLISFNPQNGYELADDWVCKHDDIFYYAKGTVLLGEEKAEHYLEVICYYERAKNAMQLYRVIADGKEIKLDEIYLQYEMPEREPDFGD